MTKSAPNKEARQTGFRLLNSKYPTIALFEDVASPEDFDALYELQKLTNPRIQQEVGNIALIASEEIPFHCKRGRSYAVAPFTHINRDGTRFADGSFGALYIANDVQTALFEIYYHQEKYWQNVEGLKFDRIVLRTLEFQFDASHVLDVTAYPIDDPIYDQTHYGQSQQLGRQVRKEQCYSGIYYRSVRHDGGTCWAMFTPKVVYDVYQRYHIEMIWDGKKIDSIKRIGEISKSPLKKV
ncbi:RES family NAD+ phosphorylase [Thaumasiovibrio subtropicus]|uniref:RES family NAD+ phosphorylase n=1 Tax=Thaumasiovibrio subtropicus TaxID=1891207 RepID=UPI000B34E24D|nr:RES family NAD+ phosphorylase [Thaumasiovibrio subtropicus]